jgi:hypothetical protein
MKKLPNKPSAYLTLALQDLTRAERSRKYSINMQSWHSGGDSSRPTCSVCLAGSVMAFSLGAKPKEDKEPYDYNVRTNIILNSIDAFRRGRVQEALQSISITGRPGLIVGDRAMPSYHDGGGKAFKKAMKELISDLKLAGL